MLRKIKTYILTITASAMVLVPSIGVPTVVMAAVAGCVGINQPLSEGANVAITNNGTAGGAVDCQSSNANTDFKSWPLRLPTSSRSSSVPLRSS